MDRLDHAPDERMAEIADRIAESRTRNFYGWATVTVEIASRNGRAVRPDPQAENPYHANIHLSFSERLELQDQQIAHANELAANAHWRERPTP